MYIYIYIYICKTRCATQYTSHVRVIRVPDPNDLFSVLFEIKEQTLTGKFLNLTKSQNF